MSANNGLIIEECYDGTFRLYELDVDTHSEDGMAEGLTLREACIRAQEFMTEWAVEYGISFIFNSSPRGSN